jgi:transcriptional/translational regulatory protein YebC/TACO1
MFDRKGEILISDFSGDEEKLFDDIINSGADDIEKIENGYLVTTDQSELLNAKDALEKKGHNIKSADVIMVPKSTQEVNEEDQEKIIDLMETIDNHDDVNQVYSNFLIN